MNEEQDQDHYEDNSTHEGGLGKLMSLKIGLIFLLFCVIYIGLIPAYSKHCRTNKITLSLMNCFAGGVFLAMAFIHILPESVDTYYDAILKPETSHSERLLQSTNSTTTAGEIHEADRHSVFPLPYLLFFVGYCLVLLIDRVLAGHYSHNHERISTGGAPCPEHPINPPQCSEHHHSVHHEHIEIPNKPDEESPDHKMDFLESSQKLSNKAQVKINDHKMVKFSAEEKEVKKDEALAMSTKSSQNAQKEFEETQHNTHNHHHHDHGAHILEKKLLICGVNITPLILLLAIGFHSIFEGIALGMAKDITTFVNLMIGVTLHHIAATISLGVSLGQHQTRSKLAIFFIFFGLSLIEPIGIAIGIAINHGPALVSSIVLSIAGGTFIYISCSEILIHEFSDFQYRYVKFLFFLVGCATITVLWFLHKHEEGEEGHEHN